MVITSLYEELVLRGVVSRADADVRAAVVRAEAIATAIAGVCRLAGRVQTAVAARLAAWTEEARARRELSAMTDRELADIGITRSDARSGDLATLGRERRASAAAVRKPAAVNENRPASRAA